MHLGAREGCGTYQLAPHCRCLPTTQATRDMDNMVPSHVCGTCVALQAGASLGWVNHHTLKYAMRVMALKERGCSVWAEYTHAPYVAGFDWRACSGPFVRVHVHPPHVVEAPQFPAQDDGSQEY